MPNSAGLGTIAYTETPPQTTMTVVVRSERATRLVPLTPRNFLGGYPVKIADGSPVAATRNDGTVGSATGEAVNDDLGNVWAIFDVAIAAGRWSFAVTEPA